MENFYEDNIASTLKRIKDRAVKKCENRTDMEKKSLNDQTLDR
jgi:hypothetical protein